jgi:hypothetical protein
MPLAIGGAPVTVKCRALKWSTKVRTSLYKYKTVDLLKDKHNKKKTLSIVFAQGNTHNYILNTTLLASTTPDTDHITSKAHSTHYQVMDKYEKFTVILVAFPPNTN